MSTNKPFGLYLLKKEKPEMKVLKDLLRFLRTNSTTKGHSFSYIEAETSLHPHLSLWENLQIEVGPGTWNEFQLSVKPEWASLVNLLKKPDQQTTEAETWEKLIVSLLKGILIPSHNLLIDMNEDLLSPFLIQRFKKSVLEATKEKTVYLATANTSLWLDCAHTIVDCNEYKFEIQKFDSESIRKHWAA